MSSAAELASLADQRFDVAFVGAAVDDRGREAVGHAKTQSNCVLSLEFDPEQNQVLVDGRMIGQPELDDLLRAPSILLEATTLGLAELFRAARTRRDIGESALTILYAEPVQYHVPERSRPLRRRAFDLSEQVHNFTGLPGATLLLDRGREPTTVVLFLGFEGQRLGQLLEQTDLKSESCNVVFGIPAYQPGWEMNAFANNVTIMREHGITSVHYAGAQNPRAAYAVLERIHSSKNSHRLLVAPIGTKPHGIAAALFACEYQRNIGLLYDHPKRQQKRSEKVARWHQYDISFSTPIASGKDGDRL